MIHRNEQRLCGGTFLSLLINARKQRMGVREHYKGESDGLSDPSILLALIKVVYPDYADLTQTTRSTFKTATSKYKACQSNGGTYIPLDDTTIAASFDNTVRTNYAVTLQRMHLFADMLIDRSVSLGKDVFLVKALVDLICSDDSILATQQFYINEDGSSMSKAEIYNLQSISIQPFLLGVLHFVIKERKDNTIGQETYDAWFPPNGNKPRIYSSLLGTTIEKLKTVTWCEISETPEFSAQEENPEKATEPPIVETTVQTVTNPFVFHQHGDNGVQIGKVENLILGASHKTTTTRCKLVNCDTGESYMIPKGSHIIGKNIKKCQLRPNDTFLSDVHVCITFHDNAVLTIKDLNSGNGTLLNGSSLMPVTEYTVQDGDVIEIGVTKLKVVVEEVLQ